MQLTSAQYLLNHGKFCFLIRNDGKIYLPNRDISTRFSRITRQKAASFSSASGKFHLPFALIVLPLYLLYSHHMKPLDLDDAAPLLSALPFGRVDPVSTVEPPAQGRHVQDNEQHNHDEQCFHNDFLHPSRSRTASPGWRDILIHMEQIARVICCFDLCQSGVVVAVRRFHIVRALIHHHVDIAASR